MKQNTSANLKNAVRRSFSRAAHTYEAASRVQSMVAVALADMLAGELRAVGILLDLGCGTGVAARKLAERIPVGRVLGVDVAEGMLRQARANETAGWYAQADVENLPVADATMDAALASYVFQWVDGPRKALDEVVRVLAPRGLFAASVLGKGTMAVLGDASREALQHELPAHYYGRAEFERLMAQAGLDTLRCTRKKLEVVHNSLNDMLRSLKEVGALVTTPRPKAGLDGPARLKRLTEVLRNKSPRTNYVVYYFLARRR